MADSKPLRVTVRPSSGMPLAAFTTNARPALAADDRFRVQVTDEGLAISCLWYPDLELAFVLLTQNGFVDLRWSEPTINLKGETVIFSGGQKGEITLEPVLRLEVESPPEVIGNVIGDLSSRRGIITEQREVDGGVFVVWAEVPLAQLRGYVEGLNRHTDGKGRASATFLRYEKRMTYPGSPPDEPMSAALRKRGFPN